MRTFCNVRCCHPQKARFWPYQETWGLAQKISDAVCKEIGKITKPHKVWFVQDMPKTRSGKIMRRVLGDTSNKNDVGDVTTLANPEIEEAIKKWRNRTRG